MKEDNDIKKDVEDELQWDPDIDATDIAVAVKSGVVTLTGYVRSYRQKVQAEQDTKRVAGVTGVANDLEVRLPFISQRPDSEIARDVVLAIQKELPYSSHFVKAVVKDARVTLEGEMKWSYQRERAEQAALKVRGITRVINSIKLASRMPPQEIKRKIEDALKRSAEVDTNRILVEADGQVVTLKGTARSWAERDEAERIARNAPGVIGVDNRIAIST
jgi:osmotically-inducible protein OsmY